MYPPTGNEKAKLETKTDTAKMFLGGGKSQCLQCPVCTASPHSWFNGDFIADTKAVSVRVSVRFSVRFSVSVRVSTASPHPWFNGDFTSDTKAAVSVMRVRR